MREIASVIRQHVSISLEEIHRIFRSEDPDALCQALAESRQREIRKMRNEIDMILQEEEDELPHKVELLLERFRLAIQMTRDFLDDVEWVRLKGSRTLVVEGPVVYGEVDLLTGEGWIGCPNRCLVRKSLGCFTPLGRGGSYPPEIMSPMDRNLSVALALVNPWDDSEVLERMEEVT
jgi:ElaB/YqjD/DUF883 family membrane-anchored ribosome-binding protein